MYLLSAVSNDGEVILMNVTKDETIASVVNHLLSTPRATSVTITRLSEENQKQNFIEDKDHPDIFKPLNSENRRGSFSVNSRKVLSVDTLAV